jgi:hypothetical protein
MPVQFILFLSKAFHGRRVLLSALILLMEMQKYREGDQAARRWRCVNLSAIFMWLITGVAPTFFFSYVTASQQVTVENLHEVMERRKRH